MKKAIKVANIILIVAMFALVFSNTIVYGAADLVEQLNPSYDDSGGIMNLGQTIISYISIVAIIVAVVVLLVLGIKYMIGSASEKAEYKKTMIPYLVGAVLAFGAGAIAQLIINATTNITSTTT